MSNDSHRGLRGCSVIRIHLWVLALLSAVDSLRPPIKAARTVPPFESDVTIIYLKLASPVHWWMA
jgi:hypothetical protein